MSNEKQEQVPHASTPDAPAPAVKERVGIEGLAKALEETGGKAGDVAEWLAKLMPQKTVMNVSLTGLGMLDPTKKSQVKDLLERDEFAVSRRLLAERITLWIDMLSEAADTSEAAEKTKDRLEQTQALFEKNLAAAVESVRDLEMTYRQLDAFFANATLAPGDKVDAWIYNANPKRLMDPDDRENFNRLAADIQRAYLSFSKRKNYGLLVLPGWLGDIKAIDRLAMLGFQNKLMVLSDGPDYAKPEQLFEFMELDAFASLLGTEPHKRNATLCANYLLARAKNSFEHDEMFVPPSTHVAGAIYRNDLKEGIQQASAGFTHGKLLNAVKTRFEVDQPTATRMMTNHALNAVVDWDGYCRVMGDQNLSREEGYDTYAKVRTEDWIVKNVLNFLNYQSFKTITEDNLTAWREAIFNFLDSICDRQGKKVILGFDIDVEATDEEKRKHIVRVTLQVKYPYGVRYFNLRVKENDKGEKVPDQA